MKSRGVCRGIAEQETGLCLRFVPVNASPALEMISACCPDYGSGLTGFCAPLAGSPGEPVKPLRTSAQLALFSVCKLAYSCLLNRRAADEMIMRSHEVLRAVLDKHNAKTVASALGLSVPHVYKWAEPPPPTGSGSVNPLERVAALINATGDDRIAEWVCMSAQGYFVKNLTPQDLAPQTLLNATAKLVKQYTNMLSLISTVIVDTQVNKQEAGELRKQWQTIQSLT